MNKIDTLNNNQISQLTIYRDKWLSIGLDTKPIDREKAIEAIYTVYGCVGLKNPDIIFADSPLGCLNTYTRLKNRVDNQVSYQVWNQVYNQVSYQVRHQVLNQVFYQVLNQVYNQVSYQVRDQVSYHVRDQVLYQASDQLNNFCYGNNDAHWLGFYEYFKDVCNLIEETKMLEGLWLAAKSMHWYLPYKNICIVSNRPEHISFNSNNKLHNDMGPAIRYRDGFSIYANNGAVIEPFKIHKQGTAGSRVFL